MSAISRATCVLLAIAILAQAHLAVDKKPVSPTTNEKSDNSSLYRLSRDVLPDFYDLLLLTNLTRGDSRYYGEVTIDLRVVAENTSKIVLHADKLTIFEEKSTLVRRVPSDDEEISIQIKSQCVDEDPQFHVLTFFDDLAPGEYTLKLYFVGQVHDDLFGFYRSSYRVDDETRWIGVTQFSPTFARRAFPCMDEPVFKARFRLRLGHYGNETVTSNTLPESTNATDETDYYVTTFSKTPPMPTYLFGWAIHDFRRVNASVGSIPLWTHLRDSELPQPLALLSEGPLIFSALEEYTGLRNPFGKLEQFAIPDFNFRAMENWGMITFRESIPLSSESQIPLKLIHDNLATMSHEYAHSWWGNVVTPEFWDVAWLKEGFATYFAYLAMDMVHESWRAMDLFSLGVLQDSLLSDSVDHNRTMNGRNVGSPKSTKAALDFVTYKKGASVIRMISEVIGDEPFRDAMRSYLNENRYKAVTPSALYKHLERAYDSSNRSILVPASIGRFVESWANQPNYPLLRTSLVAPRRILITQQVFRLRRNESLDKSDATRSWFVPVKIAAPTVQRELVVTSSWLGPGLSNETELPVGVREKDSWYVVNPRLIGYYRVDYEASNWEALRKVLTSDDYRVLPRTARAALLDDVFNLARAGYRNYELALDLAKYLRRETEYEPWVAACRAFRLLDSKLTERPEVRSAFRRYAIDLIKPIYEQLSFKEHPSDSRIKKMHRNLILSTACSLNFADCVSNAKSIFDDWIEDENKTIPANLKDFVYRVGIVNGTKDDWSKLWQRFLKNRLYSEKEIMMTALANTRNHDLVHKYLEFLVRPNSDVKLQYRLSTVQAIITGDQKNIDNVLHYLDDNLDKIIKFRGITFLEDILPAIGKEITSNERENMFTLFIEKNLHKLGNALEAGKKSIKTAKDNIAWINECAMQIGRYLNRNVNN